MLRGMRLACCALAATVWLAPAVEASRLEDQAVEIGPGITAPPEGGLLVVPTPEGVAESHARAKVTVRLLVDKHGSVRDAVAIDAPDPRLGTAAVDSLKKTGFKPATRDGKPIVVWRELAVLFRPKAELDAEVPSPDCVSSDSDELITGDVLPNDVEIPRTLKKVEPTFPAEMKASRVSGRATIVCIVDTCGRPSDCSVLNASHGAFARAGLAAVPHWRFTPARRNGKPVAIKYTIGVSFSVM